MKDIMKISLGIKILIGILAGAVIGIFFPECANKVSFLGEIFLRLLKMLMVPLVFFSISSGICKMGDVKQLRTVGMRFSAYIILTSGLCAFLGVLIAQLFSIGKGSTQFIVKGVSDITSKYSFIDTVVNWFPENVVKSMAEAELLQIIVFALFLGAALLSLKEKSARLSAIVEECSDVMIKITNFVMEFSPFGIASLIATMVVSVDTSVMKEVLSFILFVNITCAIVLFVFYPIVIKLFIKVRPYKFMNRITETMLVALSTTSSAATLPVSINVAKTKLGIKEKIYGFTLPFGNTCGMNGFAVTVGLFSVFAFNLCGKEVTFASILQFVFLGIILSVGAAGVKGAGIIMTTLLLETMGLNLGLVPIVAAIWPIIDPAMTVVNNASDLVGTALVAKSTGDFDGLPNDMSKLA